MSPQVAYGNINLICLFSARLTANLLILVTVLLLYYVLIHEINKFCYHLRNVFITGLSRCLFFLYLKSNLT